MSETPRAISQVPVPGFSRYPAYRDSGVEWLGGIPATWDMSRLKYLVDQRIQRCENPGAELPYVGLENIESFTGHWVDSSAEVAGDGASNTFTPQDVLFGKLRPYLAKAFCPESEGRCTTELLALRPFCLDRRFLFYLVLSDAFLKQVDASTYGTKMPRANWEFIGGLPTFVPPLDEQRVIASFLDRETARIDALAAKKERLVELLQEKRTALVTRAVTKGLDPKVPMKDSGVEWIGEIPEHWDMRRSGLLFDDRDEKGYPDLLVLNVSLHEGVTIREFSDEHIEQQSEDRGVYKRAMKGDIAFNKMRMWQGAVGVAPEDGLVSPDYTVARPLPGVCSEYYAYVFRTSRCKTEINKRSHGIVPDRNRLYWDDFKQIKLPYPSFSQQLTIVDFIREKSEGVDRLIATIRKGVLLLKEYRTALISAAVTGKIDVRHQD